MNQLKASEEKQNQNPTLWHTAPNSPLWDIDTIDLPNFWEGLTREGSEIEDKFYELEQTHLERLIEEEEAAHTWFEENSDWYNNEFIKAS